MAKQTELELPLGVLLNPDPQEVASDVQKASASGSSTLQEKISSMYLERYFTGVHEPGLVQGF